MKICIYGAGAVGGFIGAQLAHAGYEVNVVARGATLKALSEQGLRLLSDGISLVEKVRATDSPEELGVQDLVIVAVKTTAMAEVAQKIAPLIGPDTIVMTAMNGVPWWFFDGFGGEYAGTRLASVDPDGAIAAAIPPHTVVGCVIHGSFSLNEPGVVRHGFGKKLIIGEPSGSESDRIRKLAHLLGKADLEIVVSNNIQYDIWFKLWGNMTMNPVSALTGATCDQILDDPLVKKFCLDIMAEAGRIGTRIGCPIEQSGEERNALTRKLGAFKTSMLQDVEAGRAVELDALVGAVREIGQKVGEPVPNIEALLGLARLLARVRGLYPW
ncbi:MAG: 2-dehydropantoate 2-reductase [Desulfuromonadaceae bacterium]|nr:2-dehydropantoate 2-reductase [Desulfuromonadaceae bacterium]